MKIDKEVIYNIIDDSVEEEFNVLSEFYYQCKLTNIDEFIHVIFSHTRSDIRNKIYSKIENYLESVEK